MTQQEALQEARRRWGKTGSVRRHETRDGRMVCKVGTVGTFFFAHGKGSTWEEAFEAVDGVLLKWDGKELLE